MRRSTGQSMATPAGVPMQRRHRLRLRLPHIVGLLAGAAQAQAQGGPAALAPFYRYVRWEGAASAVQELHDVLEVDDGTVLVAGATDSLSWLAEHCIVSVAGTAAEEAAAATSCALTPADAGASPPVAGSCAVAAGSGECAYVPAVPSSELSVAGGTGIDNSGSSAGRVGFVLALGGGEPAPRWVSHFAPGAVDGVSRIRASSAPGETTQALYISGAVATASGGGYFVGKLNRNFVRGGATELLWATTVPASAALAAAQPWDVGGDGKVTLVATATDGAASWPELQRLDAGGSPEVVQGWREHYTAAGELLHATPASAAPSAVVRSVVVLESSAARCGLRSWSSADFNAFASDKGGGARRGVWPHDALMSLPCDVANPGAGRGSAGYTGRVWDASGATEVSSVRVHRGDGSVYVGLQAPSTTGTVPAVAAGASDGQLLWWSRMMTEIATPTAPVLEVVDLEVDYAGSELVVLARGRRATDTSRFLWADPASNGFQNALAGDVPAPTWSSWLGKMQLPDGVLTAATFIAELSVVAGAVANAGFVDLGGLFGGFADPNQLPSAGALLGDTMCGDVAVDSSGLAYVACTGGHTATSADAYAAMPPVAGLGAETGAASRNSFVRAYAADLSAAVYSTLVTGDFDAAGTGGDNVAVAAVSPLVGGLAVVANHAAAKQANAIPSTNTSTWGGALPQPGGSSGIVGRFGSTRLPGSPVASRSDCAAGSQSVLQGMAFGCELCEAGRYAPTLNSPACIPCALGKYSSVAGATSAGTCIQCPSGYAGAAEAATDFSQCVECAAGRVSSDATGFLCEDCAAGSYAPDVRMVTCFNCPSGKYSTTVGSTSPDCIACSAGRYGPAPGAGSEAEGCPDCPAGTWGDAAEMELCNKCAAGKASAATGATLESTCVECALGSVAPAGSGACANCAAGKYSSNRVSCALCPSGTFSSAAGASSGSSCAECAPGLYSPAGAESCTQCNVNGSSHAAWGGCLNCSATTAESLPSFAPSGDAIRFSALRLGTFPEHADDNIAAFWSSGTIDLDMGGVSPGALYLAAGDAATQALPISHENQAPFVVGGFFAPENYSASFGSPPTVTVKAHWDDGRTPLQLVTFPLVSEDGDDPAGAEELGDAPLVLGYTSFEEPVVAASAVFSDLQGQDTDHELVGSAPSCTGTPATFLPAGSCTGTARDGRDCATRFAAICSFTPGDAASCPCDYTAPSPSMVENCTAEPAASPVPDCTFSPGDPASCGTNCSYQPEAAEAEESCIPADAEAGCTGGEGAGCVFAVDCEARFALQPGTAEGDCTGGDGAGCTYTLHNPVSYSRCSVAPGAELGFRSFYENRFARGAGHAAARSVGVVGGPSTQAGWRSLDALHGSQFYEIRDVDGFAYATLDTVPVSGHAAVYVSVWVHVSADDWEADDFARVWATAEAGGPADVVVLDASGSDVDGADAAYPLAEDTWKEVRGSLAGLRTATISFGGATSRGNSTENGGEALAFDHIRVLARGSSNASGTAAEAEQRATWPLATVCPPPRQWLGGQRTQIAPPAGADSLSVTLEAGDEGAGWFDDLYATVDPRVHCWCDDGYAWEAEYGGDSGGCLYCSAGSFCTMGLRRRCPGDLISRGGQASCVPCPDGWVCEDGQKSSCRSLEYLDGSGACQACPAGSACVNARRERCPAGTWSDGTRHQCALCVPGQFASSSEATGCANCPAGQSSTVGNPSCFDCGAGETSVSGGPCTSCVSGYYSPVGVNSCQQCPAGRFNDRGPVAACQPCPAGKASTPLFTACE